MVNYEKMYYTLFNSLSDAILALEQEDATLAVKILKTAQIDGEEIFLTSED